MNDATLAMDVPELTLDHAYMEPSEFAMVMRTAAALKTYELGRLSSRVAAALAFASRGEFLQLLWTHQTRGEDADE